MKEMRKGMGKMAQIQEEAKDELCATINQGVQDVIHAVDQTAKITFPALCLIVPELVENQVFLCFKFTSHLFIMESDVYTLP